MKKADIKAKLFAQEYIKDRNGTRSYKAITKKKMTEGTARVEACKLLTKPNVQREIRNLLPNDEVETGIIKQVLTETKKPDEVSWSEVHRYLETSLKLKGYLSGEDKQQTNIAVVINTEQQESKQ